MEKNLTSRFTVQYTDRRAEQVKLCPFVLFQKDMKTLSSHGYPCLKSVFLFRFEAIKADKTRRKSYEKTIVISNSIIVFVADNGADCGVCGGYFG